MCVVSLSSVCVWCVCVCEGVSEFFSVYMRESVYTMRSVIT